MAEPDSFFHLGFLHQAHGLHGAIRAVFDVDDVTPYLGLKQVWLLPYDQNPEDKPPVLYNIKALQQAGPQAFILTFQGLPPRREAAENLERSQLYLPLSCLQPLADHQFYYHELPGLTLEDHRLGVLGTVHDVITMPAQDLLRFYYEGHEVLIPITDQFIPRIDRPGKRLLTELPEGLLEIYLQGDSGQEEEDENESGEAQ